MSSYISHGFFFALFTSSLLLLLVTTSVASEEASCVSSTETSFNEASGTAMLQAKLGKAGHVSQQENDTAAIEDAAAAEDESLQGDVVANQTATPSAALGNQTVTSLAVSDETDCPLPEDGIWCEVRLAKLPPFWMAAYADNDVVSTSLCANGHWEVNDMAEFGVPGHMLDIGGNIGYFSLAFARAGWTVTTFEPMKPNLALFNASLCRNPSLAEKIKLLTIGLGKKNQVCKMLHSHFNEGDGIVRCADAELSLPEENFHQVFDEVGRFPIRRLDEVLKEQKIDKVDLVKIDVEGYEFQVFEGAPDFLEQYHPRLIKTEVWAQLVASDGQVTGADYLEKFQRAGYKFFEDNRCQTPQDAMSLVMTKGTIDVIVCK